MMPFEEYITSIGYTYRAVLKDSTKETQVKFNYDTTVNYPPYDALLRKPISSQIKLVRCRRGRSRNQKIMCPINSVFVT